MTERTVQIVWKTFIKFYCILIQIIYYWNVSQDIIISLKATYTMPSEANSLIYVTIFFKQMSYNIVVTFVAILVVSIVAQQQGGL